MLIISDENLMDLILSTPWSASWKSKKPWEIETVRRLENALPPDRPIFLLSRFLNIYLLHCMSLKSQCALPRNLIRLSNLSITIQIIYKSGVLENFHERMFECRLQIRCTWIYEKFSDFPAWNCAEIMLYCKTRCELCTEK